MGRPTALIRRLLILEGIQNHLSREIAQIKAQMMTGGLKIFDRKENEIDIWIQYMDGKYHDEATYMRKMLDAESIGLAKRTGMIS